MSTKQPRDGHRFVLLKGGTWHDKVIEVPDVAREWWVPTISAVTKDETTPGEIPSPALDREPYVAGRMRGYPRHSADHPGWIDLPIFERAFTPEEVERFNAMMQAARAKVSQ